MPRLKPEIAGGHGGGHEHLRRCASSQCQERLELLRPARAQRSGSGHRRARSSRRSTRACASWCDVGLDYLTLSRAAATLSGGEAQRIRLATQIGAGLMGVLYILDEPSIGLHQRDNDRLIATLKSLRDQGNTVIVVEHDEDTIRAADYVIDMGPGAGELGGQVVAAGTPEEIAANPDSITGAYLTGLRQIARAGKAPQPAPRRHQGGGAPRPTTSGTSRAKVELGTLTVVTGVSGSWQELAGDRHPGARRSPTPCTAPSAPWARTGGSRAWSSSTRSSISTSLPSAVRHAQTRPPTSACGTTCGRSLPPCRRAACAATAPGASRSTCQAAAARPARETARSRSR